MTLLLFYVPSMTPVAMEPGVFAAVVAGWARKRRLDGWDLRESAGARVVDIG